MPYSPYFSLQERSTHLTVMGALLFYAYARVYAGGCVILSACPGLGFHQLFIMPGHMDPEAKKKYRGMFETKKSPET